jgi:uncharacterized OB-fold protein
MSNLRMKTPLDIEADPDDPNIIDIGWMRIVTSEYARFFWEGCKVRELRIPKCKACGNLWFYPTPRCTKCLQPAGDWIVSSGKATLYSFTTVHRPLHKDISSEPYLVAVVTLEEGVRMMANVEGATEADLKLDMPLQVDYKTMKTGAVLPFFKPAR